MSTRRYCDRCGRRVTNYATITIDHHISVGDPDWKVPSEWDLCPVCIEELYKFLKGESDEHTN